MNLNAFLPVDDLGRTGLHVQSAAWAFARCLGTPGIDTAAVVKVINDAQITRPVMVKAGVLIADFNVIAKACGWSLMCSCCDGVLDVEVGDLCEDCSDGNGAFPDREDFCRGT